jgi:hypothetical protein
LAPTVRTFLSHNRETKGRGYRELAAEPISFLTKPRETTEIILDLVTTASEGSGPVSATPAP